MKRTLGVAFLCLWTLSAAAEIAHVNILPVSEEGAALERCSVRSFLPVGHEKPKDLASRFSGLDGNNIPFGKYIVVVRCSNGTNASALVQVDRPRKFAIVTPSLMADYRPDALPQFLVRIQPRPEGPRMLWAKLIGVYLNELDVEPFSAESGTAAFISIQPGRYILLLLGVDGKFCSVGLSITRPSGSVTFHQRAGACELVDSVAAKLELTPHVKVEVDPAAVNSGETPRKHN